MAHLFYLVPLAIVGAVTVGVFIGIFIGHQDNKEWLRLKDERIETQEQLIANQGQLIETTRRQWGRHG